MRHLFHPAALSPACHSATLGFGRRAGCSPHGRLGAASVNAHDMPPDRAAERIFEELLELRTAVADGSTEKLARFRAFGAGDNPSLVNLAH